MTKKKPARRPRPSIGVNPLDVLLPRDETPRAAPRAPRPAAPTPRQGRPAKVKVTVLLPPDLADAARAAVVALAGPPERLTLARLAENAVRRELERLQKAHTGGKPFPRVTAPLVGGRPIGS